MFWYRVFDKDDDGLISKKDLRKIMSSLGDRMTKKEIEMMVQEADADQDGYINCKGKNGFIVHF